MYTPTYDEIHRTVEVISRGGKSNRLLQQGLRERLLCEECEAQLSAYESTAARVLVRIKATEPDPSTSIISISDIDYSRFKLFSLSLLWRAGIAAHTMFDNVTLGAHESDLREMIHGEDPGKSWEYPCILVLHPSEGHIAGIIWEPARETIDGYVRFRFHVGRTFWNSIFPIGARGDPKYATYLQEDGRLNVIVAQWDENEYLDQIRVLFAREFGSSSSGSLGA